MATRAMAYLEDDSVQAKAAAKHALGYVEKMFQERVRLLGQEEYIVPAVFSIVAGLFLRYPNEMTRICQLADLDTDDLHNSVDHMFVTLLTEFRRVS